MMVLVVVLVGCCCGRFVHDCGRSGSGGRIAIWRQKVAEVLLQGQQGILMVMVIVAETLRVAALVGAVA